MPENVFTDAGNSRKQSQAVGWKDAWESGKWEKTIAGTEGRRMGRVEVPGLGFLLERALAVIF